jgi:type IV pilus assembly protein PilB
MCNLILQEALHSWASDVHLEPTLNCLQVRMRIDGVLREYTEVPKWLHHPLISRLKILAHLDIAERRLPQDGRIQVKFQKEPVDLRVSTLPTHFGEKIVMRVLGTTAIPELEALGFTDWQYGTLMEALNQPQGMVLLTGPTGSGKTTTLYSMIAKRRSPEVNIVTVEDPIEYQIPGINQVQVNVKAGLTFAGCLRSILRQDPDVILIGEIRDLETAEIAFQAAVTGHLVLSTLHTNSSFAAITRLKDMGLDPFVITSSLNLVVAQRLARRICPQCKKPYTPPADLVQRFRLENGKTEIFQGEGCPDCGKSGYSGRLGIYEMFRITSPIKELIRQNATEGALRRAAAAGGTRTLMEDGLAKVNEGKTTPEELVRVLEVETEESFPCPKCGGIVHNDFRNCPYCKHVLRNICGACGQELKLDWQMCPYCSNPVRAADSGDVSNGQSQKSLTEAKAGLLTQGSDLTQSGPQTLGPLATLAPSKRPKILVVDDDEGITRVIQAALKQLPMESEVFTASDGVAALASITQHNPDMVILDVMMPKMDGFDVCDCLRKNIKTAFLPILMLTANTDQGNRTKGYLVGTDDYMNKPFDVPDFIARVARLLRRTYGL